jgi:LuxR family quorum sensing-dependent transcriptional regulator
VPKLTPRQREILAYMTKGLTNVEIAKILSIRKDTVEEHVNLLLAKLYASNRTEAVAIALRKQLI